MLVALAACGDDAPPCDGPVEGGLCRALRIEGSDPGGELGFRFGEPLDLDGDGVEELAAGARRTGEPDLGLASAWTRAGTPLATWAGSDADGLFGHVVIAMPDLDGDGAGDVVASAPNAIVDGEPRGVIEALSLDGRRLWRAVGRPYDGLGWHLARAGDRDGDGVEELWAGAPSNTATGHVYLVSGATGGVLRTIASARTDDQFGWYVAGVDDLDGDGEDDLAIGAPTAAIDGVRRGAVTIVSARTGATLRELAGERAGDGFGVMLAPMDDLDGDGHGELAIGVPAESAAVPRAGELQIFAPASGVRLRRLSGGEPGELYARSLARIDDLDGDGVRDLAIGAPWWHGRDGRFELRSARTFALLADVRGHEGGWLGWHLTRADRGVVASSLHHGADRGALDLYLAR